MAKINTSDFQKGIFIEFKSEPHQIVDMQFVNPGKGSAFVRTKLKNIKTGKSQEFTFKSGESALQIPIEVHEMQYLYKQNDVFVFMDNNSYEQMNIAKETIGNFSNFMKEGEIYQILLFESMAVGMRYPKKVRLLVTEAEEGTKGNSVTGAKKTVILETGVQVTTPLFIKKGDVIAVDPETGEYLERAYTK
ncbi:elongation factor P [Candidatus Gottesmanbacteria bacterium CG11_big_fil_rev_8_21_14_0_20_37_11]|uniref:Elongation factor P n=3 Tax=Candidatus Gottesmaniibacteriota TaxID=1752720 RepID=A0A2M7RQH1_9BACT|nr:MAG: elongation factor P [Candidatus Gottesmanbacteria bacterium CG1_02_37_22]PIP32920.1 MAG: elongation factor P [Candidatus Gottesmanbacteria bacterium CG23_combo_of_CG06-09_8_20_14_all_37_19]PIR08001.1 MAG: elongation factor P [Candidatus Gottesmanbacteria bacterium CG11_big_fil_rev_8_21_14_0_20_37_11]PIZ02512.1 MAG: elongation factor P [Candidatus Gottesmanbacteria bacterium CG_4_10_14_0_8_um_filter_37_24]